MNYSELPGKIYSSMLVFFIVVDRLSSMIFLVLVVDPSFPSFFIVTYCVLLLLHFFFCLLTFFLFHLFVSRTSTVTFSLGCVYIAAIGTCQRRRLSLTFDLSLITVGYRQNMTIIILHHTTTVMVEG